MKIDLTQKEIDLIVDLISYNYKFCNNGCYYPDIPQNVDCDDTDENGNYKCKFKRQLQSIEKKLIEGMAYERN